MKTDPSIKPMIPIITTWSVRKIAALNAIRVNIL
jgi:hypothetical protein